MLVRFGEGGYKGIQTQILLMTPHHHSVFRNRKLQAEKGEAIESRGGGKKYDRSQTCGEQELGCRIARLQGKGKIKILGPRNSLQGEPHPW